MIFAPALFLDVPPRPAIVQVYSSATNQDISWKAQFNSGTSWTAYGVVDDNDGSHATTNVAALNSIPDNAIIIGDCPNGGSVHFNSVWYIRTGLKIWWQPGCEMHSTITTLNVYPFTSYGGTAATAAITNVEMYGGSFLFDTPTGQVRWLEGWINHFKFKYNTLNGSGGLMLIRGADQEISYNRMLNTVSAAGSPGIRHISNALYGTPEVPKSPGMRANVWIHHNQFQTGDAAFQVCQPTSTSGTWLYGGTPGMGTNDILYSDSYGNSGSSALILVNLPHSYSGRNHYNCDNTVFERIYGVGRWAMLIQPGGVDGGAHHITWDTGTFTDNSSNANASIGIGHTIHGPFTPTGDDLYDVNIRNVAVTARLPFEVSGRFQAINVYNSTFTATQDNSGTFPAAIVDDSTNVTFNNVNLVAKRTDALQLTNTNIGFYYIGGTISNVPDAASGVSLGTTSQTWLQGLTITPAAGATTAIGISAATPGTTNTTAIENNISAMPIPQVCAPGQGNNFTNFNDVCFPQ